MYTYRGINYEFKNDHFIHFHNSKGGYYHESNVYGRESLVRSFPEGCQLTPHDFAKHVIDTLYDRMETHRKQELRLFHVSRSNRHIKNVCK